MYVTLKQVIRITEVACFFYFASHGKCDILVQTKSRSISGLDFALQMNQRENSHEVESRIIKIKR